MKKKADKIRRAEYMKHHVAAEKEEKEKEDYKTLYDALTPTIDEDEATPKGGKMGAKADRIYYQDIQY